MMNLFSTGWETTRKSGFRLFCLCMNMSQNHWKNSLFEIWTSFVFLDYFWHMAKAVEPGLKALCMFLSIKWGKAFVSHGVSMKYIPTSRGINKLESFLKNRCSNWFIENNKLLHKSIYLEFLENKETKHLIFTLAF